MADSSTRRCPQCGERRSSFAPSGRCRACEASIDVTTSAPGAEHSFLDLVHVTGLSLRSVRRFEALGLFEAVAISPQGDRLYDGTALDALDVIMHMTPLGFDPEQIRSVVEARRAGTASSEAICEAGLAAEVRLGELRRQVALAEELLVMLANGQSPAAGSSDPR